MDARTQCFVDLETTGRNPAIHVPYEIGMVLRCGQWRTEHRFWLELSPSDLAAHQPDALVVGRYHERIGAVAPHEFISLDEQPAFAQRLAGMLAEAEMYADIVSFDIGFLNAWLTRHGVLEPTWYFKTTCVESFMAGVLDMPSPNSNRGMSRALGVEPPGDLEAHTALGDARWVERKFDAALRYQQRARDRAPQLVAA